MSGVWSHSGVLESGVVESLRRLESAVTPETGVCSHSGVWSLESAVTPETGVWSHFGV